MKEVVARIEAGDEYAMLILKGMAYQTAKDIGAASAVLHGEVDAIIITGGIAYNTIVTDWIKEMVSFLAPFVVVPGEDELGALAMGALRVLRGEEEAHDYSY
jgi:butyrate kinase